MRKIYFTDLNCFVKYFVKKIKKDQSINEDYFVNHLLPFKIYALIVIYTPKKELTQKKNSTNNKHVIACHPIHSITFFFSFFLFWEILLFFYL